MINITPAAVAYLKEELAEEGYNGILISVEKGGCSGMKYKFSFANEAVCDDEVIDFQDFKVFISSNALLFIIGTELDYEKTPTGAKLIFNNLNSKRQCGCGKSFSF